ncbi:MAG: hypothetical protein AB7F23_01715, partial [Phycisphaerae bacterium]
MKIKTFVVVMLVVPAAVSQALTVDYMSGPAHFTAAARDVQPPGVPGNVPGLGGGAMQRPTHESAARDRGGDREQRLREQQEEASQAAEKARTLLATVASIVASGEDITEEQQREFGRTILEIRKASRAMTPEDRSDMLLADAWYGYLTGDDAGSCSKKCLSAAKLSPTSDAAYYSLAAFSVLSSEQPPDRDYFLRRVKKDAEAVRKAVELPFEIDYSPKQAVLTGKNISFAGVSEKYFPVTGREALTCIYVWSSKAAAFTAEEKAYIAKNEVLNEYAKLEEPSATTDDSLRRSIAYVKKLKEIAAESDKLEVLTINVDTDLESARDFSKKMGLEGGVFAETNEDFKKTSVSAIPQNLSAFAKLFGNTILLSDKSGQILYAGTDFGLLFRMFVTNATGGLKLPKVEGINVPSFNAGARPFGGPGMDPFNHGTNPPGIPPQMPGMTPQGPAPMPLPQLPKPVTQDSEPNQPAPSDPNRLAPSDPNQPAPSDPNRLAPSDPNQP